MPGKKGSKKGRITGICHCGASYDVASTRKYVACDACYKERKALIAQEVRRRIKRECFSAYGGTCACCGLDDWRFLAIDHIYNDGRSDRMEIFPDRVKTGIYPGGVVFYKYLQDHGYPQGRYQVLCHNCNMAKQIYGKCPHQDDTIGRFILKPKANYKPGPQDQCQTPSYAIDPLVPYIPKEWSIWEPAAGKGMMVRAFTTQGYSVLGSDLDTGSDFLDSMCDGADCVITNPPYSLKRQFIRRCYDIGLPFALLIPVETIGSMRIQQMMKQYGCELLLLDHRVNFHMPNLGWEGSGAQFPVMWYTWKILPAPICYGEINRYDEPEE